ALAARPEPAAPKGSTRVIPVREFSRRPGDTAHIERVCESGELIGSVLLPPPPAGRQIYRKVRDRASFAFALVSVAAILGLDGERVRAARITFGGLSYKPWRSAAAHASLLRAPPTP